MSILGKLRKRGVDPSVIDGPQINGLAKATDMIPMSTDVSRKSSPSQSWTPIQGIGGRTAKPASITIKVNDADSAATDKLKFQFGWIGATAVELDFTHNATKNTCATNIGSAITGHTTSITIPNVATGGGTTTTVAGLNALFDVGVSTDTVTVTLKAAYAGTAGNFCTFSMPVCVSTDTYIINGTAYNTLGGAETAINFTGGQSVQLKKTTLTELDNATCAGATKYEEGVGVTVETKLQDVGAGWDGSTDPTAAEAVKIKSNFYSLALDIHVLAQDIQELNYKVDMINKLLRSCSIGGKE